MFSLLGLSSPEAMRWKTRSGIDESPLAIVWGTGAFCLRGLRSTRNDRRALPFRCRVWIGTARPAVSAWRSDHDFLQLGEDVPMQVPEEDPVDVQGVCPAEAGGGEQREYILQRPQHP